MLIWKALNSVTGKQQKASEIWNRKKAMKVEKKRIQKKMKKVVDKDKKM